MTKFNLNYTYQEILLGTTRIIRMKLFEYSYLFLAKKFFPCVYFDETVNSGGGRDVTTVEIMHFGDATDIIGLDLISCIFVVN